MLLAVSYSALIKIQPYQSAQQEPHRELGIVFHWRFKIASGVYQFMPRRKPTLVQQLQTEDREPWSRRTHTRKQG